MTIFDYHDYKSYVTDLLETMPKRGYGQFRKIAEHLQVNSVIVSQVFKGDRELSAEQALDLAAYLGLSELETEYLVLLVQKARAGNHRLKNHLLKKIHDIQEKSKDLKARLPQDKQLSDEAKAIFYSNWYYSGIRLLSSIEGHNSVDDIANYFQLPRATVKRVIDFLLENGLCVEEKNKIRMGPKLTHLEASSPLISRHHANWRLRAMNNTSTLGKEEIIYTAPMALSQKDMEWVRTQIVEMIETVVARARDSESERLACLNIDWFDFRGKSY